MTSLIDRGAHHLTGTRHGDDDGRPAPRYRAAWVPFDDARRPLDPTPLAATWLLQQADELDLKLHLVTGSPLAGTLPPALRYVQQSGRRASGRHAGRAVLAYAPTLHSVARALRISAGGAVVVVEGPQLLLSGWAEEAGALNLLTKTPQHGSSEERSRRLRSLLDAAADWPVPPPRLGALAEVLAEVRRDLPNGRLGGGLLAHGADPRLVRRLLHLELPASSAGS